MEQIHRVDNQRRVCRVFPGRVAELLHRLDSNLVQRVFPTLEVARRPVTLCALDAREAVSRHFRQEFMDDGRLGVIGVDKDSELLI